MVSISKLKILDLPLYPIKEIRSIINEFGNFGVVGITLHKGKSIIRARPNKSNETFNSVSQLSYLPAEANKKYQRASTPNTTMFYGCVTPENAPSSEPNNARVTAIYEASKLYRNNIECGEEKITFSRWVVTNDIPLVAIVYHKDFTQTSSYTNEMYVAYQNFLKANSSHNDITNSNAITEFLAGEFAKKETKNDYDYLISALFTEMVVNKGSAGVYYPSTRTEGNGFNVAIHPNFVENNMEIVVAGECTLYKKGKNMVLDNDTVTTISKDQKDFVMMPTDPKYHAGRENCYKKLNEEIKL